MPSSLSLPPLFFFFFFFFLKLGVIHFREHKVYILTETGVRVAWSSEQPAREILAHVILDGSDPSVG